MFELNKKGFFSQCLMLDILHRLIFSVIVNIVKLAMYSVLSLRNLS